MGVFVGGETPRTPWRPLFPTIHPRRSGVPPPPLPPADLLPPPAKGETKVLSQNVAENLALEIEGDVTMGDEQPNRGR